MALAEETGHSILEIIVLDEKGIPSTNYTKKRFTIDLPWRIKKSICCPSMKSIILGDIIVKNTYLPTWWKTDTVTED